MFQDPRQGILKYLIMFLLDAVITLAQLLYLWASWSFSVVEISFALDIVPALSNLKILTFFIAVHGTEKLPFQVLVFGHFKNCFFWVMKVHLAQRLVWFPLQLLSLSLSERNIFFKKIYSSLITCNFQSRNASPSEFSQPIMVFCILMWPQI